LRDEDYAKAQSLLEEGFPRELAPDFRMLIGPLGLVLIACVSGDYTPVLKYMQLYLNFPLFSQAGYYVPIFMTCCFVSLATKGQNDRAAELMRAYLEHTLTHTGVLYPMGWAKRWGLLTRLRGQLEKSLGPEAFQAAWERGDHITMDEMANEI